MPFKFKLVIFKFKIILTIAFCNLKDNVTKTVTIQKTLNLETLHLFFTDKGKLNLDIHLFSLIHSYIL